MSSSEIKKLLKDARDAVKAKDYSQTIVKCKVTAVTLVCAIIRLKCTFFKEILILDSDHYMALVLLGASYQDTDPKEVNFKP